MLILKEIVFCRGTGVCKFKKMQGIDGEADCCIGWGAGLWESVGLRRAGVCRTGGHGETPG